MRNTEVTKGIENPSTCGPSLAAFCGQTFMGDFDRLEGDLIVRGSQSGSLKSHYKSTGDYPRSHRPMLVIKQVDDQVRSFGIVVPANRSYPVVEYAIPGYYAAFESNVAALWRGRDSAGKALRVSGLPGSDYVAVAAQTRYF